MPSRHPVSRSVLYSVKARCAQLSLKQAGEQNTASFINSLIGEVDDQGALWSASDAQQDTPEFDPDLKDIIYFFPRFDIVAPL